MTEVYIELTSACNFSCEFCPHDRQTRAPATLSLTQLERVIDQLALMDVEFVMFSAMGEPLLHPEFGAACRMVHDAGYELVVTTNGSLLADAHRELPVDRLYISVHCLSQRGFAHRRAPVSWEQYVETVRRFLGGPHPEATIYLMGAGLAPRMEHNRGFLDVELDYKDLDDEQIARVAALLQRLRPGLDVEALVKQKDLSTCRSLELEPGLGVYFDDLDNWANMILPEGYTCLPLRHLNPEDCDYFGRHLVVLADGRVCPCCQDHDGELALGNLLEEGLVEIAPRLEAVDDLAPYELCRRCKALVLPLRKGRGPRMPTNNCES